MNTQHPKMPLENPQTVTHSPRIRRSMEKGDKVPELEGKALLHQTAFLPVCSRAGEYCCCPLQGSRSLSWGVAGRSLRSAAQVNSMSSFTHQGYWHLCSGSPTEDLRLEGPSETNLVLLPLQAGLAAENPRQKQTQLPEERTEAEMCTTILTPSIKVDHTGKIRIPPGSPQLLSSGSRYPVTPRPEAGRSQQYLCST